jgi:hypothetical protein
MIQKKKNIKICMKNTMVNPSYRVRTRQEGATIRVFK